jgi:hypothetical protein
VSRVQLGRALRRGRPRIPHSDQAAQDAATAYVERLTAVGAAISRAAVGVPEENGYAERLLRDSLYGGAVAISFLIVLMTVVPTMTSTVVSVWTDRAADAQRMNLRENRPEVQESSARVADYYRQRGVGGPELSQMTATMLGGFVKHEAVAHSIQSGLRFLSLIAGGVSLLVTALLARSGVARPA